MQQQLLKLLQIRRGSTRLYSIKAQSIKALLIKPLQGLALCFLLLLTGCSDPELRYLPEQANILAFGDSLTLGVGTSADQSYPAILQQLTGRQVINAGVSGEISSAGLNRLPELLNTHAPSLIILLEGGNDILRNQSKQKLKQNLRAMIEISRQKEIDLIFIGVPEKSLFSDSAALYSELAEEYDLVHDNEIIADLLRDSRYKSDPIHFNQQGYQKLAQRLHQLMLDHGAL
ncbi:GDSL-type esterase/lipase family protein [Amphritea balenae]|uniref:GDSL-type esterase/lipase family protein n=1 Tax=Amphritea balenae TaxID=452629 RepID=UPI0019CA9942|nr:GDSL-type esterase/lipase family protein [Amphritea balenae]GGK54205.1 arylesterase [Amphritea balenae]